MTLTKLFERVYKIDSKLATENLVKGKKVYGEELVHLEKTEFRLWNPFRSKLAAALKNNLKEFPFKEKTKILYLGSAEGTTISHLSDIIGKKGIVFGVDLSARVMRKFIYLCEQRENLVPILADASQPQTYANYLEGFKIDVLFQDVSQKNQAEIFLKNARAYLKKNGHGFLTIKARSIDAKQNFSKIVKEETEKLKKEFTIIQEIDLAPFDKEHAMVFCKKK
jgi:fibrillarin-like pre-rRNA processing protein